MPRRTPIRPTAGAARGSVLSPEASPDPESDADAVGSTADRSATRGRTGIPARAWIRFALLASLLVLGFALVRFSPLREYLELERAVAALDLLARNPMAPVILVVLWVIAATFGIPVSPLVFAGGAVFGTLWGWIYSLIGATLGAAITFWIARQLGHELVAHWLGEERLRRVEDLVGRHGFWTVSRLRFAPLPFALVNTGAALAGMRLPLFVAASILGLAPSLWVYNYFSHALVAATAADRSGVWRNLFLALAAFLAITLLPPLLARLRSRSGRRDDSG